jgi:DNA repair protein RecO
MHHIYTTKGLILNSVQRGEADKVLTIFTRDMGLIYVFAQGARLEKSKLRYHIEDYSWGTFSLVRGKDIWRLTGAETKRAKKYHYPLLSRLSSTVRRFVHGEDVNEKLFDILESFIDFLDSVDEGMMSDMSLSLESLLILYILNSLGYIGTIKELSNILSLNKFTHEILSEANKFKNLINIHINKAFKESHL